MQKTPSKNLQDLFKTYVARSGDEEKFRKTHVTTTVDNNDKKLGPKEDQFVSTNVATIKRDATHHGYEVGDDEKVYSEETTLQEAMDAKDRFDFHHQAAKALIKSIGEHLATEKKTAKEFRGYNGIVGPNWSHVNAMSLLTARLGDIHDMLAQKHEPPLNEVTIEEAAYKVPANYAQMIAKKKKKASQMTPSEKQEDAARRKEYNARQKSERNESTEITMHEKTLTPAEMKKREDVAQAIERDNPDMPMGKKMAIATATAKRVAEEIELGESVLSDDAFNSLRKAGAKDPKTTSGGIVYTAGGKEYNLRHNMKRTGHRTVRSAELEQHLDRLNKMNEAEESKNSPFLKEGAFKAKMLTKGMESLSTTMVEVEEADVQQDD